MGSYRRTQLWEDRYVDAFLSIVGGYPDVVAAMMFGHLHTDEFRALATPPGGGASPSSSLPPLLLAPSITPVHGNNPSYRVVTYDGSGGGDVLDYETYFLDLNRLPDSRDWHRLYSFRETYGKALMGGEGGGGGGDDDDGGGPITAAGLTRLIDTLRSDWRTLRTFVSLQRSGAPQPACRRRCRAEWACLLEAATMAEYEGCAPGRWFGLAGLFGGGDDGSRPGGWGGGTARGDGRRAAAATGRGLLRPVGPVVPQAPPGQEGAVHRPGRGVRPRCPRRGPASDVKRQDRINTRQKRMESLSLLLFG